MIRALDALIADLTAEAHSRQGYVIVPANYKCVRPVTLRDRRERYRPSNHKSSPPRRGLYPRVLGRCQERAARGSASVAPSATGPAAYLVMRPRPPSDRTDAKALHCPARIRRRRPVLTFRLTSCQKPGAQVS